MTVTWSAFHDLDYASVRRCVPTGAGVYLLWLKLESGDWRCYYVGQAGNLEERLFGHLAQTEENKCIKEHLKSDSSRFYYSSVDRQADRNGIEKFLYDYYSPECNEMDPGGTPIRVNLPR